MSEEQMVVIRQRADGLVEALGAIQKAAATTPSETPVQAGRRLERIHGLAVPALEQAKALAHQVKGGKGLGTPAAE